MKCEIFGKLSLHIAAIAVVCALLGTTVAAGIVPGAQTPKKQVKPEPKKEVKLPEWISKKIEQWRAGPAGKTQAYPPIYTYKYKGKKVYLMGHGNMPQVFDAEGNLLGSPWGGFTGQGDGRLPNFRKEATDRTLFWSDPKAADKEVEHYKRRIKMIEGRMGAAQALKSIKFWLRSNSSRAAKKFLEAEKKRLEKVK